jgi:manganese/zinc/iron transport system substrate-binding protein
MRGRSYVAFAIALLLGGCQRIDDASTRPDLSNRKARIVATTGMIADIARQVGGDRVEVECLLGPGGDPHKYYPLSSDMAKLREADLILYNGLDLEAKMGDVFADLGKKRRTLAVASAIDPKKLRQPEPGFEGAHDPHIWFDVKLWMKAVEAVRGALVELDPKNANAYNEQTARYLEKLQKLDDEIRQLVAAVPPSKRVIITAHDAFGYFGRAYGFEVKGLQGTSTATQAGTQNVQELAKLIGERKIPVIFGETSVPDEGIKAVLEAVSKQYPDVRSRLSEKRLYSDALGEPGSGGDTYIGMARHNARVLAEGLSQ